MLSLFRVDDAQIKTGCGLFRVALNLLFIGLSCLAQLSGDIQIVIGRDRKLLPLAGMVAQLEGFSEVFTGPSRLGETEVLPADYHVTHGKIRVELDRSEEHASELQSLRHL